MRNNKITGNYCWNCMSQTIKLAELKLLEIIKLLEDLIKFLD